MPRESSTSITSSIRMPTGDASVVQRTLQALGWNRRTTRTKAVLQSSPWTLPIEVYQTADSKQQLGRRVARMRSRKEYPCTEFVLERRTVCDGRSYCVLWYVTGWRVMAFFKRVHLKEIYFERFWGWVCLIIQNLKSATSFFFPPYYSPSSSVLKYTSPTPSGRDWGNQPWLLSLLTLMKPLYHTSCQL